MTIVVSWFFALASASPAPVDRDLPYTAWKGRHYPAPNAVVLDAAPAPAREEPETARRRWEFVPDFGIALPACRANVAGCSGIGPGFEIGLSGLYRAVPYFAFGATARLDVFSVGGSGGGTTRASATFFGLVGRLYPFESGFFDPYLELSLGAGSLEAAAERRREGTHVDLTAAARAAGGLDFAVSSWLRLGPTFAISEYASRTATVCTPEGCARRSASQAALPRGATTLGFRLTISAGEPL